MRMSFNVSYDEIVDMVVENAASKGMTLNREKISIEVDHAEGTVKNFKQLVVSLDMKGMADAGNLTSNPRVVKRK